MKDGYKGEAKKQCLSCFKKLDKIANILLRTALLGGRLLPSSVAQHNT